MILTGLGADGGAHLRVVQSDAPGQRPGFSIKSMVTVAATRAAAILPLFASIGP
jgi:hypothetical protein